MLALSAWWQLRFMDSLIAWQGQSALAWVEKLWRAEAFAGDFPTASDGEGPLRALVMVREGYSCRVMPAVEATCPLIGVLLIGFLEVK